MPERPDLEYFVPILARELRGAVVSQVRVRKPVVLRVAVVDPLDEAIIGATVGDVTRRAHFVLIDLVRGPGKREIVVSPMLAGRFTLAKAGDKDPADLAVALSFEDGRELRYRDDVQMGKFYVIDKGDWRQVPGLERIGVDVLDAKKFTKPWFRGIAKQRRDQVKVFLMDKAVLDAMGNAYADEVLFEAGIHPKTMVRKLPDADLDKLHAAIVKVLTHARDEIARRKPATDEKLRDFLQVRNKHGAPCPRCGGKIRKAGVHGHDAFFCPDCQPETRKTAIVDWKKVTPKGGGPS
jgi:formamidopyrimidine-DNA glycosylase